MLYKKWENLKYNLSFFYFKNSLKKDLQDFSLSLFPEKFSQRLTFEEIKAIILNVVEWFITIKDKP